MTMSQSFPRRRRCACKACWARRWPPIWPGACRTSSSMPTANPSPCSARPTSAATKRATGTASTPANGCTPPPAPPTAAATPACARTCSRWPISWSASKTPDGYLGTYAPSRRFMQQQRKGPRSWDGAPGKRTWDIWTHSYLILGMLEVHRYFPDTALPRLREPHRRPVPARPHGRRHRHHRSGQPPRHVGHGAAGPRRRTVFRHRRKALPDPGEDHAGAGRRQAGTATCLDRRWPASTPPRSPPVKLTNCAGTWWAWPSCTAPPAPANS